VAFYRVRKTLRRHGGHFWKNVARCSRDAKESIMTGYKAQAIMTGDGAFGKLVLQVP
jgi:hypothetical protein